MHRQAFQLPKETGFGPAPTAKMAVDMSDGGEWRLFWKTHLYGHSGHSRMIEKGEWTKDPSPPKDGDCSVAGRKVEAFSIRMALIGSRAGDSAWKGGCHTRCRWVVVWWCGLQAPGSEQKCSGLPDEKATQEVRSWLGRVGSLPFLSTAAEGKSAKTSGCRASYRVKIAVDKW